MASPADQRFARLGASVAFRTLARCLALVWLLPALLFNVDWTGHGSWHANTAAVIMILGSALFIEGAVRLRSAVLSPLCAVAAVFLVYVNTKQATRTLSFASEAASEAKQARIDAASHLASQRSHLLARREAQSAVAGESATTTLEAALEAIKVAEPTRWRLTKGCDPDEVTKSRDFCLRVAQAREKISAATERDKIDAEIGALAPAGADRQSAPPPKVADAYVANWASLIELKTGALSRADRERMERLIVAEEALSRALGLELLAALGPTCWNAFVGGLLGMGGRTRRGAPARPAAAQPSAEPKATADDTVLDRFAAEALDACPAGGSMRSAEIKQALVRWCAGKGLGVPRDKEVWAFLKGRFTHDANNGRPRYLGVRPKRTAPALTVVGAAG